MSANPQDDAAAWLKQQDPGAVLDAYADSYGVPRAHARAIMGIESGGNQNAISNKGAVGRLQLMPETAKSLGVDPHDPIQNIEGGIRYYKQQLDQFKDPILAAAAYNAGPENVKKYNGVPPFSQTQQYVRKFAAKTQAGMGEPKDDAAEWLAKQQKPNQVQDDAAAWLARKGVGQQPEPPKSVYSWHGAQMIDQTGQPVHLVDQASGQKVPVTQQYIGDAIRSFEYFKRKGDLDQARKIGQHLQTLGYEYGESAPEKHANAPGMENIYAPEGMYITAKGEYGKAEGPRWPWVKAPQGGFYPYVPPENQQLQMPQGRTGEFFGRRNLPFLAPQARAQFKPMAQLSPSRETGLPALQVSASQRPQPQITPESRVPGTPYIPHATTIGDLSSEDKESVFRNTFANVTGFTGKNHAVPRPILDLWADVTEGLLSGTARLAQTGATLTRASGYINPLALLLHQVGISPNDYIAELLSKGKSGMEEASQALRDVQDREGFLHTLTRGVASQAPGFFPFAKAAGLGETIATEVGELALPKIAQLSPQVARTIAKVLPTLGEMMGVAAYTGAEEAHKGPAEASKAALMSALPMAGLRQIHGLPFAARVPLGAAMMSAPQTAEELIKTGTVDPYQLGQSLLQGGGMMAMGGRRPSDKQIIRDTESRIARGEQIHPQDFEAYHQAVVRQVESEQKFKKPTAVQVPQVIEPPQPAVEQVERRQPENAQLRQQLANIQSKSMEGGLTPEEVVLANQYGITIPEQKPAPFKPEPKKAVDIAAIDEQARQGIAQRAQAAETEGRKKTRPEDEATAPAQVPAFITTPVRQALADLGYPKAEIDKMKPEDAQGFIAADKKYTAAPKDEYTQAVDIVRNEGRGSSALLQRRLGIGYGKAIGYLNRMTDEGILGPGQEPKPRIVIQKPAETPKSEFFSEEKPATSKVILTPTGSRPIHEYLSATTPSQKDAVAQARDAFKAEPNEKNLDAAFDNINAKEQGREVWSRLQYAADKLTGKTETSSMLEAWPTLRSALDDAIIYREKWEQGNTGTRKSAEPQKPLAPPVADLERKTEPRNLRNSILEYEKEHDGYISLSNARSMAAGIESKKDVAEHGMALTPAAEKLTRAVLESRLADPETKKLTVVAGSVGNGKSTYIESQNPEAHEGNIWYETHLEDLPYVRDAIDRAIKAGKKVDIIATYRDPVESYRSALERFDSTGKVVPVDYAARLTRQFSENWPKLVAEMKDKPGVRVVAGESGNLLDPNRIAAPEIPANLEQRYQEVVNGAKLSDVDRRRFLGGYSGERGESQAVSGPGREAQETFQEGKEGVKAPQETTGGRTGEETGKPIVKPAWTPPEGIEKGIPHDEPVRVTIPLSEIGVSQRDYDEVDTLTDQYDRARTRVKELKAQSKTEGSGVGPIHQALRDAEKTAKGLGMRLSAAKKEASKTEAPAPKPAPAISQPTDRASYEQAIHQHFGYKSEEAKQHGAIADAIAETYARQTGKSKEDFYRQIQVTSEKPEGRYIEQIPPEVARRIQIETKLPDDPIFKEAVKNTPGAEITSEGLKIDTSRFQRPEQAGASAIRTGVFYLPEEKSPQARYYRSVKRKTWYGGQEKIEGPTLLRRPLFVKGATGGKAPQMAYDAIMGDKAVNELNHAIMNDLLGILRIRPSVKALEEFILKHGGDPSTAADILHYSKEGNQLPYAISENIIGNTVRKAGYDSILGYSRSAKGPRLSEVFDLREAAYPSTSGAYRLRPEFTLKQESREPNLHAHGDYNRAIAEYENARAKKTEIGGRPEEGVGSQPIQAGRATEGQGTTGRPARMEAAAQNREEVVSSQKNLLYQQNKPSVDKAFNKSAESRVPQKDTKYHVTYSGRLEDIERDGLQPGSYRGIGGPAYDQYVKGKVFLTDPEGVSFWHDRAEMHAEHRSDDVFEDGYVPVVLRIKGTDRLAPDEIGSDDAGHPSYTTDENIPPDRIEFWDGKKWRNISDHFEHFDPELGIQRDEDGVMFRQVGDNPLLPIDSETGSVLYQQDKPVDQTQTPEFKKWFGKSKALNTEGEPLVLYHQTSGESESGIYETGFDINRPKSRAGDEQVPDGIFLKPTPADIKITPYWQTAAQIPLYTRLENPLRVNTRDDLERWASKDDAYLNTVADLGRFNHQSERAWENKWKAARPTGSPEERQRRQDQMNKELDEWDAEHNRRAAIARARLTELLRTSGYDGVIIENDRGSFNRSVKSYIALDPTQVKSSIRNVGTFDPNNPNILQQGPKGATQFLKDNTAVIHALKNPDQSTAVHELHHAVLPIFMRIASESPETSQIAKDMATMEKWMGLKQGEFMGLHGQYVDGSLEGDSLKRYTAAQEKGARGFEKYLREGKAPTPELTDVFTRFKAWLTDIYQKLTGSDIDIKLSKVQRQVWDRLLGAEFFPEEKTVGKFAPGDIISSPKFMKGQEAKVLSVRPDAITVEVSGKPRMIGKSNPAFDDLTRKEQSTGIKNAVTLQARQAKGQSEVEVLARRKFGQIYDEGKRRVDAGEIDPRILADTLSKNPRPISAEDSVALIYDRQRLQNEHRATRQNILDAISSGDRAKEATERMRLAVIEDNINTNDEASRRTGYEQGIGLAARRMMAKEDYSLDTLTQRARVANLGKAVPEQIKKRFAEISDQLEAAQVKLEKYEQEAAQRAADDEIKRVQDEEARQEQRQVKGAKRTATKKALDDEMGDLDKQFAQAVGKVAMNPLFDPKPYALIAKMVRNRVKAGIVDASDLADSIHEVVKNHIDGVTKRDVMEAISGYGKPPEAKSSDLQKELGRIKQEINLLLKLEDAEKGIPAPKKGQPPAPVPDKIVNLRQQIKQAMLDSGLTVPADPQATALKAYKTRLTKRQAELESQIEFMKKTGEPVAPKPKRTLALDPDAMKLQEDVERLKLKANDEIKKIQYANRGKTEKLMDFATKWRRATVLSSIGTGLVKLPTAAAERIVFNPIEEIIGGGVSQIPGLRGIAKQAPREGGFNVKAEARAFTELFHKAAYADIWQARPKLIGGTGHSQLDVLYGRPGKLDLTPEAMEFFGHLHSAVKVMPKRVEFFRALEKRSADALRRGLDLSDPVVQSTLAGEAYNDAQRSIFMQDNVLSEAYQNVLRSLEHSIKSPRAGKALAFTGRMLMPIVKVPTNFAIETGHYIGGIPEGLIRAAMSAGVKGRSPVEADAIMRALKKGTVGAGMMLLGYLNPDQVGGYYQPGEKRKDEDLKPSEIRLFGFRIPHLILHHPALEALQFGATIRRVQDKYRAQGKDGGALEGIGNALGGVAEQIPFIEQPTKAVTSVVHGDMESKSKFAAEFARSATIPPDVQKLARGQGALSYIPGLNKVGDVDETGEPVKRMPRGFGEHFIEGVPIARKTLPGDSEFSFRKKVGINTPKVQQKLSIGDQEIQLDQKTHEGLQKAVLDETNKAMAILKTDKEFERLTPEIKQRVAAKVQAKIGSMESDRVRMKLAPNFSDPEGGKDYADWFLSTSENTVESVVKEAMADAKAGLVKPKRAVVPQAQMRMAPGL